MRVCAQASCYFLKFDFKLGASTGTTHRAFHAKLKRHLLKDWAMLVLTVIHRMHQFMHQRIKHLNAIAEPRRDKDLIHLVGRRLGAPALADVPTFNVSTGKATGHMALGYGITLFFK